MSAAAAILSVSQIPSGWKDLDSRPIESDLVRERGARHFLGINNVGYDPDRYATERAAPDGRWVMVQVPRACPWCGLENKPKEGWDYDAGERVVLGDGDNLAGTYSETDGKTDRVVGGVNYASYGLIKIGRVWVNAQNPRAIRNAQNLDQWQNSFCVIL